MPLEMLDSYGGTGISRRGMIRRGAEAKCFLERKRQGQWRLHRFFVLVVLLLAGKTNDVCWAQSLNDAVAYLDNIEKEVIRIAAKATENFVNTCDLVASCGESCSRQSCEPVAGDLDLLICKNVAKNTACVDSSGNLGCSQLRVILSKSFVRVSTPPNITLTSTANYTICSQRMLDPLFLEISNRHNNAINLTSTFYMGSVEGVQRSFPGRDVLRKNCVFDPRKRPWYMAATAVIKDLVILLDGGNSMGDVIPVDIFTSTGVTKFDASINIIKDLLDTLTYGDRVSIVLFSSSSMPYVVYKTMTATNDSISMTPLKDELDKLSVDNKQGSSNFSAGILKLNETYLPDSSVLKVMVVLTDGNFADNTALTSTIPFLTQLRSRKVLPLIYSFDRADTSKTVLSKIACNVNGTYERIEKTVQNPLWTLRSYFGIIARWRLQALQYRPYWKKAYIDSGSSGQVITVAYPVFAPDNYTLVGVVGSDVLLTELGSFASTDFSSAMSNRSTDDPVVVTPEPLRCNVALSELNSCPNVVAPASPLCPGNDTSGVSFEERVCNCPPTCKAPKTGGTKSPLSRNAIIAIASLGGFLALVVVLLLLSIGCSRTLRARRIENHVSTVATKSASPENSLPEKVRGGSSLNSRPSDLSTTRPNTATFGSPARRQKSTNAAAWPVGNQSLNRDVIRFTMKELEEATNNWSEAALVGKGACGSVYSGELHGKIRAIKKPHPGVAVAKSTFDKELDLLSTLNHRCLVRLVGYCEDERVLVFEYMQHGTVEDCLHKNRLGRPLSWEERLKIAAGASKGLEYLHEYANTMIIHGDVKPANILLDDKLEAHIADFGLSLSSHDQNAQMLWASRMGGTPGYFDPELALLGSFTPKSDVYSFGIVLLEILSGRKAIHERRNITTWAAEMYEQDVAAVLDPSLEPPQGVDSFHAIIALALQCVQTEHRYRPKMKDVAAKLSSAAADWHKFEQESSLREKKHPSRRQHPQYRPSSSLSDDFESFVN